MFKLKYNFKCNKKLRCVSTMLTKRCLATVIIVDLSTKYLYLSYSLARRINRKYLLETSSITSNSASNLSGSQYGSETDIQKFKTK